MEKFINLIAWKKAHELVLRVYLLNKKLPQEERFILVPQVTRAAISIAANLAEGTKRRTLADQRHFFNMAETSLEEVKYYFILMKDLGYISDIEFQDAFALSQDVGRLINCLINKK